MNTTPSTRPETAIDLSDLVVNHDPYPYFEQIRAIGPAVWSPASNAWLVTSFDHVKSTFANPTDFAQDAEMFEQIHGAVTMVGLDNPRHSEVRGIIARHVSRAAAENHAELAQEVINEHLDPVFERMRAGETVDVSGLYRTIATQFVARLLGVPLEDCEQFVKWAEDMAAVFDLSVSPDLENAEELRTAAAVATKELGEYADALLEERQRAGRDEGLIGAIATTDVPLTAEEKRAYVVLLIQGGQDTVATLAKNVTTALALNPDQRRTVVENRELIRQTIDEVVRWRAPVMIEIRIVRNDGVDIGGVPVAKGDQVILLLGAAHRDPSRWENPETFDVTRPEMGNLGFGFGVHGCVGVNLAKRLVTSLTNTLLDQVPDYRLAIPTDELDYGRSFAIRGATKLPLSL